MDMLLNLISRHKKSIGRAQMRLENNVEKKIKILELKHQVELIGLQYFAKAIRRS